MVKVVAENFIRKADLDKAIAFCKELVRETWKEEGCIAYNVFQDDKDETHLTFIEEWESQEILDKHFKTPHFTKLVPEIGKLAEKEGIVNVYSKIL